MFVSVASTDLLLVVFEAGLFSARPQVSRGERHDTKDKQREPFFHLFSPLTDNCSQLKIVLGFRPFIHRQISVK